MKKCFSTWVAQQLGFALIVALMFGCSDTEEPLPEVIKDSLYFEFTLGGEKYKSEIKETVLLPRSGVEVNDDFSNGMNLMHYDRYSNIIWMSLSNKCGTNPGKDCLDFIIQVPDTIKVGDYPSLFTHGIKVNEQGFTSSYSGSKVNDLPDEFRTDLVITKYDELNNIVEGAVKGKFYKFHDDSEKVYFLTGEFRVYLFTN